jgi:hypothetical protein
MSKTFTHVGYSKLNGVYKARFANDALRVKVLEKGGHEDVQIEPLATPMTKEEAVAHLIKINFTNGNPEAHAALEAELDKRVTKPQAIKVPKAITIESIRAKATATTQSKVTENDPF